MEQGVVGAEKELDKAHLRPLRPLRQIGMSRDLWVVLLFVCIVRIGIFAVGCLSFNFNANQSATWYNIWYLWDAPNYAIIARGGYVQSLVADSTLQFISRFPPAFPLAMWLMHLLFQIDPLPAGQIISLLSLLVGSLLLYQLVLIEFKNKRAAYLSVIFLNLYPASYIGNTAYTEAPYLLLSILYFYLLRVRGSFALASCCLFFIPITRVVGLTLVPVHLYAWAALMWRSRFRWYQLVCVSLPFVSYGVFWFYTARTLQMPGYSSEGSLGILSNLNLIPYRETVHVLSQMVLKPEVFADRFFMQNLGINHLYLAFMTGAVALAWKRFPLEYQIYLFFYLLVISLISWNISASRYVWALFPVHMSLAQNRNYLGNGATLLVFSIFLIHNTRLFVPGGVPP